MSIYEKVIKDFLKKNKRKKITMLDCYDCMSDYKITLYEDDKVEILYAPKYQYIEVIGLSSKDYNALLDKYGY